MPSTLRLILDPPADGAWNMAVDEALAESAAVTGLATLRFYTWRVPTLSLGYFQQLAERSRHAASAACPVVRRGTGGGAIVHDDELTYSIALPPTHPLARRTADLYRAAHQTLVEALSAVSPAPLVRRSAADAQSPEPFLCFQRRAEGDVLCGVHKLAGSAQRRTRGGVLQHGSVLLRRSPAGPELPGWCDLAGVSLSAEELARKWLPGLAAALGETPTLSELTSDERRRAAELHAARHAADSWIARR